MSRKPPPPACPWVIVPEIPEAPPAPRELPPQQARTPQPHVASPPPALQLPVRLQQETAGLWWVGAHGGSGERTLAALRPQDRAAEHAWPAHSDRSIARVVLVARTNHAGMLAAGHAAQHWASGQLGTVQLHGLVLVADAPGRLPRELRRQATVLAGGVPRTWELPWVDAWRHGNTPAVAALPAPVRALLADLDAIT